MYAYNFHHLVVKLQPCMSKVMKVMNGEMNDGSKGTWMVKYVCYFIT